MKEVFISVTMENKKGKQCPYYPCHKDGVDSCFYCVCPFYPCRIHGLGRWIPIASGDKIWDCTDCNLPHRKEFINMIKDIRTKNMKRWGEIDHER